MIHLALVGIGTGNPEHLTLQAIRALNAADVVMIPRKGETKADLAELRRSICADVLTGGTRIVEFDLPVRDAENPDYRVGVDDWHDAIARTWRETMLGQTPPAGRVAMMVWGDPSLYDSTLRIAARLQADMDLRVEVIPGITALQGLTAAHAIPINDIGAPFTVTTGRNLRDQGWPPGTATVAVMLDGDCAFRAIAPEGVWIWWGAYVGMPQQVIIAGDLSAVSGHIVETRARLRAQHGWIMDIYILRRT